MAWDPEQYHKFQTERTLPFYDLLNLIEIRENLRVIDLGCGTGELTLALFRRLPDSEVLGIDSSAEMLAAAQEKAQPDCCEMPPPCWSGAWEPPSGLTWRGCRKRYTHL